MFGCVSEITQQAERVMA